MTNDEIKEFDAEFESRVNDLRDKLIRNGDKIILKISKKLAISFPNSRYMIASCDRALFKRLSIADLHDRDNNAVLVHFIPEHDPNRQAESEAARLRNGTHGRTVLFCFEKPAYRIDRYFTSTADNITYTKADSRLMMQLQDSYSFLRRLESELASVKAHTE